MELTPSRASKKLGNLELGLCKSTNTKTLDRLVWAARNSTGLPVLVRTAKALPRADWVNAKWKVVRKGADSSYPQSSKLPPWQTLDRRRLLLVGTHNAVYEIVLPEPTVNSESKAFFPIRLQCEVGGLELVSKSFFVLAAESLSNMTKYALHQLDEWFLNPDMGLMSVIQSSTVRSKSLAAAFLKKHSVQEAEKSKKVQEQSVVEEENLKGVRARFVGGDNALLRLIEKVYPVPVPIDNALLLIAVSQLFHFTHESIHWVGDHAHTKVLNSVLVPPVAELERQKLHVYGSIFPLKGMYQHSNPRLKKPFEVLCTALKVLLAANGLPKSWVENDGKVLELTDQQVKKRQFCTYEEVFGGSETAFNVNQVLEAMTKSVWITKAAALCIDYSVLIPVLVNSLSELHSFFGHLTRSRLKDMIGHCMEQLFAAQSTITELGNELAEMEDNRVETGANLFGDAAKNITNSLKLLYSNLQLHITQGSEFDCFISPAFDLYESGAGDKEQASETILDFSELIESDLSTSFRFCIKGLTGCGKTTICRFIAKEWARGRKMFNGKFDLVILVPLDVLTTVAYADVEQVTLVDFVEREIVRPNEELSVLLTDKAEVQAWLQANSNRILWLLDGVEALEEFMENPSNASRSTVSGSGIKSPRKADEPPTSENAVHNVKELLASFGTTGDVQEDVVKHRIVTANLGCKTPLQADLYLMIRLFSNANVREYVGKFFPSTEELSSVLDEGKFILDDNSRSNASFSEEEKSVVSGLFMGDEAVVDGPKLSERAKRIWMSFEKLSFLAKDLLHVPMTLELVCASYLSDLDYHLTADVALSDLYGHLYVWLLNASGSYEIVSPLEKHLFRLAYSSLFKAKFACPTVYGKILNIVPREYRLQITDTRFFEQASVAGKGHRFVHTRVREYLAARFLAEEEFSAEVVLRLKAKVINRDFHPVYLLLVGMLREDKEKLNKLWDIILMEQKDLELLGPRGPPFVFKCFEETNFDRVIRSRVIDWFWGVFGKPTMQIWRSNYVINLLELVVFKLAKKGADSDETTALKAKGVRAFGQLGVENPRVIQLLVKAARSYPVVIADVVQSLKDLSTNNLGVIPVLLDSLKTDNKDHLKVSIGELRRLIVPGEAFAAQTAPIQSPGGKGVVGSAATRLIKIGMNNFDETKDLSVLVEVLRTLAQWRWGDDSALPLLVKCLECLSDEVRRSAMQVVQYVDLLGPNVYYNERLVVLLETLGKREPSLRGDVVACFLALGMENDFVRGLIINCLSQEDAKLQSRILILCGQHYVKHTTVVESMARIGTSSSDQQARRVAIDILAFILLPKYVQQQQEISNTVFQADINACIDTLFALGLSSKFVAHRVTRMCEKKRKSAHLSFAEFSLKYIV